LGRFLFGYYNVNRLHFYLYTTSCGAGFKVATK